MIEGQLSQMIQPLPSVLGSVTARVFALFPVLRLRSIGRENALNSLTEHFGLDHAVLGTGKNVPRAVIRLIVVTPSAFDVPVTSVVAMACSLQSGGRSRQEFGY